MWWLRLGAIVGFTCLGIGLAGCSRRSEENHGSSPVTPSIPSSSPPPMPPPSAPPIITFPSSNPTTNIPLNDVPFAPVAPNANCSRYQQAVQRLDINNPRTELDAFRRTIIPYINRHIDEINRGDYTRIAADTDLSAALLLTQGWQIYLREGVETALDTESDFMNINTAYDWLTALDSTQADSDPNSVASQVAIAWRQNRLSVSYKGFYFRDSRVPHRSSASASSSQDFNRFRIVNPRNWTSFPDFSECHVPESAVYGMYTRPASR
ncbi:MAG: hypothetical protein U1F57_08490 [bacterium]